MSYSFGAEQEDSSNNLLGDSSKVLETEQMRRLRENREMVEKITMRLYTKKRNPTYIAEHREVQSKVLNLRQITRQAKMARSHSSLSSIHNLSLSMIEDIKGARVRRQSGVGQDVVSPLPRQNSLVQLGSRKGEPSSYQMKLLTAKMEQILQVNSSELAKAEKPTCMRRLDTKARTINTVSDVFPRASAEVVRTQLNRDIRRLGMKLRLLVSSLLLLEEEIKLCTSNCFKEKKRILQKRVNSLYTLMDFLKDTRERAIQYVRQIDCALTLPLEDTVQHGSEESEWLSALGEAVAAMSRRGKAIDFVASQVDVRVRPEITKKELMKYEQVTFSAVVPKIMGRHLKSVN